MEADLLKTKLYIPQTRHSLISRPRLAGKLNASLNRRLTLISAPAGFGKTTLIANWLAGHPSVTWLALDPLDNDVTVFWQYMIAAVQQVGSDIGLEALQILRSPQYESPQAAIISLVNDIEENALDLRLVLDDYQVIETREVHESLAFFLDRISPAVHIVLLTRIDPPLPLGRLRANGNLQEIRASDLRFSLTESADFLSQVMDLKLDQKQVKAITSRTEGWVAGLQMAGLSIQGLQAGAEIDSFVDQFTGSHRHIFDYLTDEVLAHQAPETELFLLQTSLLDQFNASLCNAVTGSENSQVMLDYLERSNLFLFPLDDDRGWYRYHHLFASLLQRRLRNRIDLLPDRLNQLAAEWYEAHGMISRAIRHLWEAKKMEDIARLIQQYGAEELQPGQLNRLQRWLDSLPADIVQSDALLAVLQSWIYYFEQQADRVFAWVEHAQHAYEQNREHEDESSFESLSIILGLRSWVACQRGDYQLGVQLAQQALEILPENDRTWRGKIYILLAEALAGMGRTADSIAAYEMSIQYKHDASNWIATSAITAGIWMTKLLRGQLNEARHQFDRVIIDLTKLGQTINASSLRMARLAILYEQNDLDQVGAELSDLWKYVRFDSSIAIARHHYLSAKYHTSIGERDLAYRSLQSIEEAARSWSAPDERARAIGGCMRLYLRLGERVNPAAWLRNVEYDPTNLTLLRNDEYLAVADVLRFSDSVQARQDGIRLVDALLKYCDDLQIYGIKIEVYCLKALLLVANDDLAAALAALDEALSAGQPEGYVRTFLDFGEPMAELLREAADRDISKAYARSLLEKFPQAVSSGAGDRGAQTLIEPLSDRELEVLTLLASHLSGPQIAERLHISTNTIKTHIRNIYTKLGVNSRDDAVTSAQELGLL